MEISSVQHRAMATHVDEVVSCPKSNQQLQQQQQQQQETKKPRPHPEQALKCPRCDSSNTKFCYYNNYSLSQPRYFCKGCRRYWTRGGSLRNVPVGGGCRKNKRSSSSSSPNSSSSSSSSSSKKSQPDLITPPPLIPALPLPPLSFDPNDLTLAFANDTTFMLGNPNPSPSPNPGGFLDILRNPTGSFQNLYYGFGGEEVEGTGVSGDGHGHHLMMFPNFDGGLMNNSDSAEAAENTVGFGAANGGCKGLMDHGGENSKGVMGTGWPAVGGGDRGSSLGPDWNAVGSASSWHGLINSSLM